MLVTITQVGAPMVDQMVGRRAQDKASREESTHNLKVVEVTTWNWLQFLGISSMVSTLITDERLS